MPEEALKIIAAQAEQIRQLTEQVKILTAQLAWFQRQMYGRKSEKLAPYDPNQLSLFDEPITPEVVQAQELATEQIKKETPEDKKQ